MKLYIVLLMCNALPTMTLAKDFGCAAPGASMYTELRDSLVTDLHIDASELSIDRTKVQILSIAPVSKYYAEKLAESDVKNDSGVRLKQEEYFETYYLNNSKSITAEYTFTNTMGKRSIFIASSLFNNDECSIRYNGYLTLAREF